MVLELQRRGSNSVTERRAFDTGTGPHHFNVGVRVSPADATAPSTIDEMTCNVRVIADNADELSMQAP